MGNDPKLPPEHPESKEAVVAVAEQVKAGNDSIAVPAELTAESAHPAATMADVSLQKPLWAQIRDMNTAERIKLALRGNKEARMILLRDSNDQIRRLVLQNPRITEEEIVMVSRDRNTDEEILKLICESRDWVKIYALRAALVENARTPTANALRLLATLDEKDLSRLGKSKAVPNVISVQARRLLLQMRERRH